MAKHKSADIRNIVLCGHSGAGKTILADAMLMKANVVTRLGSVADGSTTSDFMPEEKHYQYSLSSSIMHCTHAGKLLNIIDTPGATDFVGSTITAIAGADLALVCINAGKGIEMMARNAWDTSEAAGIGRVVVITRMDTDNVNYQEVLSHVQKTFGKRCVPFTIPDGEGDSFKGVARVMAEDATGDQVDELRMQITESAVESDDALMEKYLEEGEVSSEEIKAVMQRAIATGSLVPVFCLASEKDIGVVELMDGIAEWGPDPLMISRKILTGEVIESKEEGGAPEKVIAELAPSEDGPFMAQVFKVVSDPHVGKICYFRIFSGKVETKGSAYVSGTGKQEKFAQLFVSQGEKREDVTDGVTGDIIGVTKIDNLHIGDTIYSDKNTGLFPDMVVPNPMTGLAVSPKSRGDEQKLGTYMKRLCEEDLTFIFERNAMTGQQVIRGMGQVHLDVMLSRLKGRYGMEVDTKPPKIPYLETICKESEGRYRHKKQSGGSGQFGEVHLRIRPNQRGGGFEFINAIVGGVISQPFIPSVEKGVKAAMEEGPVAGYPLVDVVVELFFGKEHPVDSKDIAFQLAGRHGFNEIVKECKPILLEPVVNVEIAFPARFFGDISGDISTRRGRPTGTDQLGEMQVLKAQVPLVEISDYGSSLKAITGGEGTYSMEFSHYDPVPSNLASQVAAKAKAEAEAEK